MRTVASLCLILFLAPVALSQPAALEPPQDILARAVQAHGGAERLSKARSDRVKIRGTLFVSGKEAPFTGEVTVALPSRFRNVLTVNNGGRDFILIQVLNGERAWVAVDGQPQKPDPAAVAEMRDAFYVQQIVRLAPLVGDRRFTLKTLPDVQVGTRTAAVIRVQAAGRKDLTLSFDRATGLLCKTEYVISDGAGKEQKQEVFYGDYRDVGGYIRPLKMAVYRDGKKIMDAELTDVHYLDRVDDADFNGP
jgi:hypothetical protein